MDCSGDKILSLLSYNQNLTSRRLLISESAKLRLYRLVADHGQDHLEFCFGFSSV